MFFEPAFVSAGVIEALTDLFFAYQWNSQLHYFYLNVIVTWVGLESEEAAAALVQKAKLADRVIAIY
jgi:hypothetical protein